MVDDDGDEGRKGNDDDDDDTMTMTMSFSSTIPYSNWDPPPKGSRTRKRQEADGGRNQEPVSVTKVHIIIYIFNST